MSDKPLENSIGDASWHRRLLLGAAMSISAAVGLLPFGLMTGKLLWLVPVVAALLGVAAGAKANERRRASRPNLLEFALVAIAAIYPVALLGLLLIVCNFVVLLCTKGTQWVVNWLGREFYFSPVAIAFFVTVMFELLLAFGFLAVTFRFVNQYLNTSGQKLLFRVLRSFGERKTELFGVSLVTVSTTFLVARSVERTGVLSNSSAFFMQLSLTAITSQIWSAISDTLNQHQSENASERVGKLLAQAGYLVETKARRTVSKPSERSDSDVDPAELDIIASKDGRSLAIQVKTMGDSGKEVSWRAVPSISRAVWKLSKERDLPRADTEPMLVLVGVRPDGSLRAFGEEEHVRVAEITDEDLTLATNADVSPEKRAQAVGRVMSSLTGIGSDE